MRALLALGIIVAAAPASAQPWAEGVTKADQARANALFAEANRLFAEQAYPAALDTYRAALAIWNHPVIRFNMAVTLFKLERFVDAADTLAGALAFGDAPFSPDQLAQISDYQAKLRGMVGELSVTCTTSGTHVLLDGKDWFTCPASRKQRVLAGEHAVVADRTAQRVSVTAGSKVATEIRASALEVTERRWEPWIPWTVAISGGVLGLGSTGVVLRSKSLYDDLEVERQMCISDSRTCTRTEQELAGAQNRHVRIARYMTIPFVIGTVACGSGIVMLLVNHKVRRVPAIEVVAGDGGGAATASWQF